MGELTGGIILSVLRAYGRAASEGQEKCIKEKTTNAFRSDYFLKNAKKLSS